MKPIRSLSSFKRHSSSAGVIRAMMALFRNPKRHLRGPFFSASPGNGQSDQYRNVSTAREAVSACAAGAKELFSSSWEVRERVARVLNIAAYQLEAEKMVSASNYVIVSERDGLDKLRLVLKRALKNLRASA